MTDEDAKRILESIANDIDNQYPVTDAWYANALREIALLIVAKQDEIDSVWQVLEEMRLSDIENHQKEISKHIEDLLKEKKKMAKASEA
jgi:hypothetical protein